MTLTDFLQPLDLDAQIRVAKADTENIYFGPAGDLPRHLMERYEVAECLVRVLPIYRRHLRRFHHRHKNQGGLTP